MGRVETESVGDAYDVNTALGYGIFNKMNLKKKKVRTKINVIQSYQR